MPASQWNYKIDVVYSERELHQDINVLERLQRLGDQGWECFRVREDGKVLMNDGTQRGREVLSTTLFLKKPR